MNPLNESISTLKKIPEKTIEKLQKLGIYRIIDLLFYFPSGFQVRKFCDNIRELQVKQHCVIKLTSVSHHKTPHSTQILCQDIEGNFIKIYYFKKAPSYILNYYPLQKEIVVLGKPDILKDGLMISHPQKVLSANKVEGIKKYNPVYSQHHEIVSSKFQDYISQCLDILQEYPIPEWLDEVFIKKENLVSFKEAMFTVHNPTCVDDLAPNNKYYTRLSIDELLAYQISLQKSKLQSKNRGISIKHKNKLSNILLKNLPFVLTDDQVVVSQKISEEISTKTRSTILLQGDVGSGKTIVCFLATLYAKEAGYQSTILAPSSILAIQHYENFKQYEHGLGIKVALLKGAEKTKIKQQLLQDLKDGIIDILIGTHAILEDNIIFKKLGLIIIDEQHKFGVKQRKKLLNKGVVSNDKSKHKQPNLILATATPIPRTLVLSYYGDIKTFSIRQKPNERQATITRVVSLDRLGEVLQSVRNTLQQKEKIFWVCSLIEAPLVETSLLEKKLEEKESSLTSVNERYEWLKENTNATIFLIHGKMKQDEKDNIMNAFKDYTQGAVLVSTTVIEVGVDIPSCNILIIENAEQFGLASLHQLRGRVGRGDKQGKCLLLYGKTISYSTRKRLNIIKNTNDGFIIAEEDVKIRGSGDIIGTQQSGFDYFKIYNISYHSRYLDPVIQHANYLITLNKNIDILLEIFNKDAANIYHDIG